MCVPKHFRVKTKLEDLPLPLPQFTYPQQGYNFPVRSRSYAEPDQFNARYSIFIVYQSIPKPPIPHVQSTRAMTRERGSGAESKNCEILLFLTADKRFDTKVKCPTGQASFWVKFPTVQRLTQVKCPGIARGDGRFWN